MNRLDRERREGGGGGGGRETREANGRAQQQRTSTTRFKSRCNRQKKRMCSSTKGGCKKDQPTSLGIGWNNNDRGRHRSNLEMGARAEEKPKHLRATRRGRSGGKKWAINPCCRRRQGKRAANQIDARTPIPPTIGRAQQSHLKRKNRSSHQNQSCPPPSNVQKGVDTPVPPRHPPLSLNT